MNRDNALLVAQIVDRITKLEQTIFDLQNLTNNNEFVIIGTNKFITDSVTNNTVKLNANEIATVVFTQDILEMFINTLNLELNELVKELENF